MTRVPSAILAHKW